ncbi:uncharacterized protein LOC113373696 [Ctenocephalides felis]|uniref:uncharacterized protein LOC113373696 n=1 Tax=Ctenocephalides felis TaxID=7515 RepID=UPI000E6E28F0|nr:uncharacterized protein LOC113373696 [Ctenocephalides felis]
MDSDFFCTECQIPFTARSSLYRHIRQKHDKEPRAVYPNACAFCLKTFKFKYLLTRHVSQVHNNIPNPSPAQSSSVSFEDITHLSSSTKTNIKHPSLPTSYTTTCLTSPYNLLSPTSDPLHKHPHVSLLPHPCTSSIKVQIHTPPIPCSPISTKENFTGTPSRKSRIRCPLPPCSSVFSRYTGLYDHIEFYHKTTIDYEQFVFQNIKDFELWKTDIERKEFSHYVKCNSGYKSKTDDKTIYFDCHRSYTNDQKPTVRLFTKTSNKTGYACPSRIGCTINHNGTVHVEFWKTHVGHSQDIKFISLDKNLKEHIKEFIKR